MTRVLGFILKTLGGILVVFGLHLSALGYRLAPRKPSGPVQVYPTNWTAAHDPDDKKTWRAPGPTGWQ